MSSIEPFALPVLAEDSRLFVCDTDATEDFKASDALDFNESECVSAGRAEMAEDINNEDVAEEFEVPQKKKRWSVLLSELESAGVTYHKS